MLSHTQKQSYIGSKPIMKPAILLVSLFCLLFAFSSTKLASAADDERVVDIDGDPILPGSEYYIVSAIRGAGGGGVRPGKTGNSKYPVSVIQEPSDLNKGVPVKFTILGKSVGIIFVSTRLEIDFTRKPPLAESGKWVVVTDSKTEWVGISGPKDHPGDNLLTGAFSIEKSSEKVYTLAFHPAKRFPPFPSFDIGRKIEDGKRLLILTREDPFRVVFVKANVHAAGTAII